MGKLLDKIIVNYPARYTYKSKRLINIGAFSLEFIYKDSAIFYLLPNIKYWIKRWYKRIHKVKPKEFTTELHRGLSISMAHEPAYVFENGKKVAITSLRDAKEYAKRNNCEFGSDDLDQEAIHQRDVMDKEYENNATDKIVKSWEFLQRQKKASK